MTGAHIRRSSVLQNFSNHADQYDGYAIVQERVVDRLLQLLKPSLPPSGAILDVGCGTAKLGRLLQAASPKAPLFLCDIAHGMTLQARKNMPNALTLDADAGDLPFRSGIFSLVCSSSALQWVSDLERAFCEAGRVLAPGGLFAFALFGENTLFELKRSYTEAHREVGGSHSSHLQVFPGEDAVRNALCWVNWGRLEVFTEYEIEYHRDVVHLLRALKGIGAQNASTDRPAGLASRRLMNRMIDCYGEKFGGSGGIPATYQVIYGLAVKER